VALDAAASTHYSVVKLGLAGSSLQQVSRSCSLAYDSTEKYPDIDENNARTATENVKLNNLESRIRVFKTEANDLLFPLEKLERKR